MANPDLLTPGEISPQHVSALPRFKNVLDDGRVVASVRQQPTVIVSPKYYFCRLTEASMHRTDGTRITFRAGLYKTSVEATQQYLDAEIADEHEFIRPATKAEADQYEFMINPGQVARERAAAEVQPEIETRLRAEMESRLREILSDPTQLQHAREHFGIIGDEAKIGGTDELSSSIARARELNERGEQEVIRTEGATVKLTGEQGVGQGAEQQSTRAAPLGGITSTSSVEKLAAASNTISVGKK